MRYSQSWDGINLSKVQGYSHAGTNLVGLSYYLFKVFIYL